MASGGGVADDVGVEVTMPSRKLRAPPKLRTSSARARTRAKSSPANSEPSATALAKEEEEEEGEEEGEVEVQEEEEEIPQRKATARRTRVTMVAVAVEVDVPQSLESAARKQKAALPKKKKPAAKCKRTEDMGTTEAAQGPEEQEQEQEQALEALEPEPEPEPTTRKRKAPPRKKKVGVTKRAKKNGDDDDAAALEKTDPAGPVGASLEEQTQRPVGDAESAAPKTKKRATATKKKATTKRKKNIVDEEAMIPEVEVDTTRAGAGAALEEQTKPTRKRKAPLPKKKNKNDDAPEVEVDNAGAGAALEAQSEPTPKKRKTAPKKKATKKHDRKTDGEAGAAPMAALVEVDAEKSILLPEDESATKEQKTLPKKKLVAKHTKRKKNEILKAEAEAEIEIGTIVEEKEEKAQPPELEPAEDVAESTPTTGKRKTPPKKAATKRAKKKEDVVEAVAAPSEQTQTSGHAGTAGIAESERRIAPKKATSKRVRKKDKDALLQMETMEAPEEQALVPELELEPVDASELEPAKKKRKITPKKNKAKRQVKVKKKKKKNEETVLGAEVEAPAEEQALVPELGLVEPVDTSQPEPPKKREITPEKKEAVLEAETEEVQLSEKQALVSEPVEADEFELAASVTAGESDGDLLPSGNIADDAIILEYPPELPTLSEITPTTIVMVDETGVEDLAQPAIQLPQSSPDTSIVADGCTINHLPKTAESPEMGPIATTADGTGGDRPPQAASPMPQILQADVTTNESIGDRPLEPEADSATESPRDDKNDVDYSPQTVLPPSQVSPATEPTPNDCPPQPAAAASSPQASPNTTKNATTGEASNHSPKQVLYSSEISPRTKNDTGVGPTGPADESFLDYTTSTLKAPQHNPESTVSTTGASKMNILDEMEAYFGEPNSPIDVQQTPEPNELAEKPHRKSSVEGTMHHYRSVEGPSLSLIKRQLKAHVNLRKHTRAVREIASPDSNSIANPRVPALTQPRRSINFSIQEEGGNEREEEEREGDRRISLEEDFEFARAFDQDVDFNIVSRPPSPADADVGAGVGELTQILQEVHSIAYPEPPYAGTWTPSNTDSADNSDIVIPSTPTPDATFMGLVNPGHSSSDHSPPTPTPAARTDRANPDPQDMPTQMVFSAPPGFFPPASTFPHLPPPQIPSPFYNPRGAGAVEEAEEEEEEEEDPDELLYAPIPGNPLWIGTDYLLPRKSHALTAYPGKRKHNWSSSHPEHERCQVCGTGLADYIYTACNHRCCRWCWWDLWEAAQIRMGTARQIRVFVDVLCQLCGRRIERVRDLINGVEVEVPTVPERPRMLQRRPQRRYLFNPYGSPAKPR